MKDFLIKILLFWIKHRFAISAMICGATMGYAFGIKTEIGIISACFFNYILNCREEQ